MNLHHRFIQLLLPVALIGLVLPVGSHAKKEAPWDEFSKASHHYEELSRKYKKMSRDASGDKSGLLEKLSDNYDEMAEIKEDAAKDMRKGRLEKFDWSEYEKLARANDEIETKLGFKKAEWDKKVKVDPNKQKWDKDKKKSDDHIKSLEEKEKHLKNELEKLQKEKKSASLEKELKEIQRKKQELEEYERTLKEKLKDQ